MLWRHIIVFTAFIIREVGVKYKKDMDDFYVMYFNFPFFLVYNYGIFLFWDFPQNYLLMKAVLCFMSP